MWDYQRSNPRRPNRDSGLEDVAPCCARLLCFSHESFVQIDKFSVTSRHGVVQRDKTTVIFFCTLFYAVYLRIGKYSHGHALLVRKRAEIRRAFAGANGWLAC